MTGKPRAASNSFRADEVRALDDMLRGLQRGTHPGDIRRLVASAPMRRVTQKVQRMRARVDEARQRRKKRLPPTPTPDELASLTDEERLDLLVRRLTHRELLAERIGLVVNVIVPGSRETVAAVTVEDGAPRILWCSDVYERSVRGAVECTGKRQSRKVAR